MLAMSGCYVSLSEPHCSVNEGASRTLRKRDRRVERKDGGRGGREEKKKRKIRTGEKRKQ